MIKGDDIAPVCCRNGRRKHRIMAGAFGTLVMILMGLALIWKGSVLQERLQGSLQEVVTPSSFLSNKEKLELEKLGLTPRQPLKLRLANGKERKLHGRFLHITDMHPDLYYEEGSSINKMCHRGKPSAKKDYAPRFGRAMSGCDAPLQLMNETLNWIEKNLRDKIDFVVWTGDNIRHDNDRDHPRTEAHIFSLNQICSDEMHRIFCNHESENPRDFDVIVIPSIGNNDVFPHNMLALGPTLQTREYYRIWAPFIPQDQLRVFNRGVCFVSEVIPGKLAVLSINTLYLFKANPLVDTCDSKKEPGYHMLVWLGTVLEELRQRGLKVWLSGHVPPIPKNMEGSCFHKYTLWTHEYRDIIIGGLYGHMNIDHFIPLDSEGSWEAVGADATVGTEDDNDSEREELALMAADLVHEMGAKPVNKVSYMEKVRYNSYKPVHDRLEEIQAEKKKDSEPKTFEQVCERYSIVNVAGSVVPTFNPSFRVWEYNTTGLDLDTSSTLTEHSWDRFYDQLNQIMAEPADAHADKKKKKRKKKKSPKKDKTIPRRMPNNLPLGPGYAPQLFSPTKFVQYYADLKAIDKEYRDLLEKNSDRQLAGQQAFKYQVEYTSSDEPYPMSGLLVKDYVMLASQLAENKTQWKQYMYRSFLSSGYND